MQGTQQFGTYKYIYLADGKVELKISSSDAEAILSVIQRPSFTQAPGQPILTQSAAFIAKTHEKISTGSRSADELLSGGLSQGQIIEISGPPGTPKEALAIGIVKSFVNAGHEALFVDCQHMSSPATLDQALGASETTRGYLQHVYHSNILDLCELMVLIYNLPKLLKSHPRASLLVFNSISFPFQAKHDLSIPAKNALLERIKQAFIIAVTSHNLTIVTTSQLSTKILNADGSPGSFDTGAKGILVPQLGLAYLPGRAYRMILAAESNTHGYHCLPRVTVMSSLIPVHRVIKLISTPGDPHGTLAQSQKRTSLVLISDTNFGSQAPFTSHIDKEPLTTLTAPPSISPPKALSMHMVSIDSKAGPSNVSYTISTPTCASAEKIDPGIPTVIFLHPVYMGKHIFHTQFRDPKLRRFNLIALDTRLHGDTEGKVKDVWRSEDAVYDMVAFMDALRLPPCHFLGVSMGMRIALQMGILYPEKVLSLFLVSPIPAQEPAEILEGREEIWDYWVQGWTDPEGPDTEAIKDSVGGAEQLGFNSLTAPLVKAILNVCIPNAVKNLGPGRLEEGRVVTVGFFSEHMDYSTEKLKRIPGPVKLIYCGGDIAYTIHQTEDLFQRLIVAGIDVELEVVEDAPHFGTVMYATEINPLLHDFLMKQTTTDVPVPSEGVISPFEAILVATGWSPDHDDDSFDEEEEFFDFQSIVPRA
ncbi:hypothetical protein C0995_000532 [Termitomyces sp. Mi166|nr:hypothetical protein C0995_000532 [Termitomyces sp. Mi166\